MSLQRPSSQTKAHLCSGAAWCQHSADFISENISMTNFGIYLFAGANGRYLPESATAQSPFRAHQICGEKVQCLAHLHSFAGVPFQSISKCKLLHCLFSQTCFWPLITIQRILYANEDNSNSLQTLVPDSLFDSCWFSLFQIWCNICLADLGGSQKIIPHCLRWKNCLSRSSGALTLWLSYTAISMRRTCCMGFGSWVQVCQRPSTQLRGHSMGTWNSHKNA